MSIHDTPNFDEDRVPAYALPPLFAGGGPGLPEPEAWRTRREELLRLLAEHVYGSPLPAPDAIHLDKTESWERDAMTFTQMRLRAAAGERELTFAVLAVRPAEHEREVPAFVMLNFQGNHTVVADEQVWLASGWVPKYDVQPDNVATEGARGAAARRVPLGAITRAGYGFVTVYAGDIDPDFDDGFQNGVHALFPEERSISAPAGTIGAWAWGLSRILDVVAGPGREHLGIDPERVAALGHSRMGKAALWAAACDERFAAVCSNESGRGGASLARRIYGETVEAITTTFPHWFTALHASYARREHELPVDQHMLLALLAPRPLAIGSAQDDRWADTRGQFLAAVAAAPAWRVHGLDPGLPEDEPPVGEAVGSRVSYHCRAGVHDLTPTDWEVYLDFFSRERATSV